MLPRFNLYLRARADIVYVKVFHFSRISFFSLAAGVCISCVCIRVPVFLILFFSFSVFFFLFSFHYISTCCVREPARPIQGQKFLFFFLLFLFILSLFLYIYIICLSNTFPFFLSISVSPLFFFFTIFCHFLNLLFKHKGPSNLGRAVGIVILFLSFFFFPPF